MAAMSDEAQLTPDVILIAAGRLAITAANGDTDR